MNLDLLQLILAGGVLAATPLAIAAIGEVFAEDSGVINLGVEGMMLVGAISAFLTVVRTSNLVLAVVAAMLAAGALSLVHAFLTITLRTDQVVSGLSITLFGTGLSQFVGKPMVSGSVCNAVWWWPG